MIERGVYDDHFTYTHGFDAVLFGDEPCGCWTGQSPFSTCAGYGGLMNHTHMTVRHSAGEYVNAMAHTNGIESFWALLKRGYYGVYHYMSVKHLDRYVNEFANRQNTLKLSTLQFMGNTAERMVGRHISYKELIGA